MDGRSGGNGQLRLAELIASFSLALDLGLGLPLENFLRSCLLAVRLGETLRLRETELAEVYYLALLRYAGCTAETRSTVQIFGDDVAANRWLVVTDQGRPVEVMAAMLGSIRPGEAPLRRAAGIARAAATMPMKAREVHVAHCEVAQGLAGRLGFPPAVVRALGQMSERWDGRGYPGGLKGEQISLAVRIVQLSADAALFHRRGGIENAIVVARRRAGGPYDPALVAHFCRLAPRLLPPEEGTSNWEAVLAAEPEPRATVSESQLDAAAEAIGAVADLKTPYLTGHSTGVGELVGAAAARRGLRDVAVVEIRRAGFLHDIGRIGVSSAIWEKAGPLTDAEWERVRLHPYYTERVLRRPRTLASLGALAAQHHERLDGSGYYRGTSASALPIGARLLAAADTYQALTEPRPYRPPHSPHDAADILRREARDGRLDYEAVSAVLDAAGHRVRVPRHTRAAGLTEREIEVLRLVSRGLSNREIAKNLSVSPRTIEHHVEHIFDKTGVSTRAAATYFAMQHHLLADDSPA